MRNAWHSQTANDVIARLGVDSERGLSRDDALQRTREFGPNRLERRQQTSGLVVFGRQFRSVLVAILVVAALISISVGEGLEAAAILAIVFINAVFGFVQEWRAERALAALESMLSSRSTVVRDGVDLDVDAETLVPGDVVLLESGDRVAADMRIVKQDELQVDESALTGESTAVAKGTGAVDAKCPLAERTSMVWAGTLVTHGHGRGVVVDTGMATEFGRIAELTRVVERDTTPLQAQLATFGRWLGVFALAISAAVAIVGWLGGRDALEMFMTGVSLAVAVVPEGLPAAVTITLALGVKQMVRKRALPRRLQAVETLGAVTTILTDKTGTITENEMTVTRVWLPGGAVEMPGDVAHIDDDVTSRGDLRALLETGLLCSRVRVHEHDGHVERIGEPTEVALVVAAHKVHVERPQTPVVSEVPFSSERKRMTVLVCDDECVAHCKGAPEVLLELCAHILDGGNERPLNGVDRRRALEAYRAFASAGMRTLALARRTVAASGPRGSDMEEDLVLLGIVGMTDPPRPEVPDAVARARASGVRVIMLTGDAPETARAIAKQVGITVDRVLVGRELDDMDDTTLARELTRDVLLARASPEQKLRVANLLKDAGEVISMTGDGVNDAPSLRRADVGIAMGIRGTDVAREAADIVLTDDNFASIVNAIEEGRREYDNIRKFLRYLLSSNIGETVAVLLTIIAGLPLILLPVQILWINVVTDAVTAIALGLEPAERDVMRRAPRGRSEGILGRSGVISITLLGGYIGVVTLGLFLFFLGDGTAGDLVLAQTVAFTAMVVMEQVNLFNHRSFHTPNAAIGLFSNPWLLVAWIATFGLQLAAVYVPFLQDMLHTKALDSSHWVIIFACALPLFIVPEARKWLRWRSERMQTSPAALRTS